MKESLDDSGKENRNATDKEKQDTFFERNMGMIRGKEAEDENIYCCSIVL